MIQVAHALKMKKVIALIDMDCFYAQVEQRAHPEFRDKPTAAVYMGFKANQGGGLIAITYDAKDRGVTRLMNVGEALKVCPELNISYVPEVNGKIDLTRFREAGKDVMNVLCQFCNTVEKASVDEWFLDLTDVVAERMRQSNEPVLPEQLSNTCVTGWQSKQDNNPGINDWLEEVNSDCGLETGDHLLAVAAVIVEEMRAAVYRETTFRCSAGIAHNKTLAKMGSWLNKPNRQTVIPESSIPHLFEEVELKKVRNLGGKLGTSLIEELGLNTMSDLRKVSSAKLKELFGVKTGTWLSDLGQGIDNEVVRSHHLQKSIACSKNFFGKNALTTRLEVQSSIFQLAKDVLERLVEEKKKYKRVVQLMTLSIQHLKSSKGMSRSFPIAAYDIKRIHEDALKVLEKHHVFLSNTDTISPPIVFLGLSASKFVDQQSRSGPSIETFFVHRKSTPNQVCLTRNCDKVKVNCLLANDNSAVDNLHHCNNVLDQSGSLPSENLNPVPSTSSDFGKAACNDRLTNEPVPDADAAVCDDCGKFVSMWDLPEHTDYHVALKLQSELNDKIPMPVQQNTHSVHSQLKTKTVPPRKKFKSLYSFFTPEQGKR